jgi:hypothetical protein
MGLPIDRKKKERRTEKGKQRGDGGDQERKRKEIQRPAKGTLTYTVPVRPTAYQISPSQTISIEQRFHYISPHRRGQWTSFENNSHNRNAFTATK